jgi:ElaA protein
VDRIDVRRASFEELEPRTAYLLWQLRESVFVVEQQCCYPELDGRDLEPGTGHLWVEDAGQPVGYLRILDDGDHLRIGRVLVAPSHRGRGLAETLMRSALAFAGDRGVRLDAQSYLEAWYAGLGFRRTGAEFLDDGIPHVPMERVRVDPVSGS